MSQPDPIPATHNRLAPVIPIGRAARTGRTAAAVTASDSLANLVHGVQINGTVDVVLPPTVAWADVTGWSRQGCDRLIVIDAPSGHFVEAVGLSERALARLGARPRLHLTIAFAPDRLTVAPCGLLADPVMTPAVADSITDTLNAAAPASCRLGVTDDGALHWQLVALSDPVPLAGLAESGRRSR